MKRAATHREREIALARRLGISIPDDWTPANRHDFDLRLKEALIAREREFAVSGRKKGSKTKTFRPDDREVSKAALRKRRQRAVRPLSEIPDDPKFDTEFDKAWDAKYLKRTP